MLRIALSLSAFVTLMLLSQPSHACAMFVPAHERVIPKVEHEDVLLAWDQATHTEHFVRRARFAANVKSFAFIVPTPSVPQLAEAPDSIFAELEAMVRPKEVTVERTKLTPRSILFDTFARSPSKGIAATVAVPVAAVHVLSEARLAGMNATVLAATDAKELTAWLNTRGFSLRDSAAPWVQHYIDKKWVFTAFKYDRPDLASRDAIGPAVAESQTVRLSFKSEVPVYPYLEPADATPTPGRELRLWVAADERRAFTLESGDTTPQAVSTPYAQVSVLKTGALGFALPSFITYFVDRTERRPNEDARFLVSKDRAAVTPPVITHETINSIPLPVELGIVPLGVFFAIRKRKRRGT
jgi:hypothetical protein